MDVNCPRGGELVEVSIPDGYSYQASTAEYGDGPPGDRRHDRYIEVSCDCEESFWVFYR